MRCRDRLLVIALALLIPAAAYAQSMGLGAGVPDAAPVYPRGGATSPGFDFVFSTGSFYQNGVSACVSAATCLTTTRATTNGSATNLLPTSASGQTITTFPDNTARVSSTVGGIIIEEPRVNQLLNATVPVTQTSASISCATPGCTLWVNGSGSATASAGTATGCSGFAAATNGAPNTFICTGAGTITVTVSGSLNAFQLEIGGFGTSLCTSGATACSRGGDTITVTTTPAFGNSYSTFVSGVPGSQAANPNNQAILSFDDGTTNNRLSQVRANTGNDGQYASTFVIGGVAQTGMLQLVAWAQGTSQKTGVSSTAGAQAMVVNGALVNTGVVSPILAGAVITLAHIGSRFDGTLQFNGVFSRVAVWPTVALTTAQMQALTK